MNECRTKTQKHTHTNTQRKNPLTHKHTQSRTAPMKLGATETCNTMSMEQRRKLIEENEKWHVNRNGFAEANKKPNALYSKSRCHCPSG